MLAYQTPLSLPRPIRARSRSVRRPFHPSQGEGPYRLPHAVRDRLSSALAPFRNRDAAFALAVFVARFHSAPGRIVEAFPLDRRALAEHGELDLTEARVRSAIRVLEEIGFLDRAVTSGSKYKPTEDGLHRKPIWYMFGSEYFPLFDAANKRAARARGGHSGDRRSVPLQNASRASTVNFAASKINSPKNKSVAFPRVSLGELRTGKPIGLPPKAFEPDPKLEAALENLKKAAEKAGRV